MSRLQFAPLVAVVLLATWLFPLSPAITWAQAPPEQQPEAPAEATPAESEAVDSATEAEAESTADADAEPAEAEESEDEALTKDELTRSFSALIIGIIVVLGLIIVGKVNAFLALITAAMVVSLMGPGDPAEKMTRVAAAFGSTAGSIGIVIALASIIGTCMLDSGAADKIVRAFVRVLGEKRAPTALMGSGFLLAIPVFFDTVFYLLVPLARSLYKRTGKNYLMYLMAICAGGAITHGLVPPTPGPLTMAATLNLDLGVMILVGGCIALPASVAGLFYSKLINRLMPLEMRELGTEQEHEPLSDEQLPGLIESLLPVVLPVLLISSNTVVEALMKAGSAMDTVPAYVDTLENNFHPITAIFGNPNFALLISTVIAMFTLMRKRNLTRNEMARVVETSLMSGGLIILITSGGGAFGGMLKAAEVGTAIQQVFAGSGSAGMTMLFLGFLIAAIMKVAQGSSTVAMITTAGMLVSVADPKALGFDPVYLATAIGSGATCGSWMNDSGFWIVAKMGGLTETETLKSWTLLLLVLGVTGFLCTLLAAQFIPFPVGTGLQ